MPPVTKSSTYIYLIGHMIEDFPDSVTLPTNGQALLLLSHYIRIKRMRVYESSMEVCHKVIEIWNNCKDPPVQLVCLNSCSKRLTNLHEKWRKIYRTKTRKLSSTVIKKRKIFTDLMKQVFDISKDPTKTYVKTPKAPAKPIPEPPPLPEKRIRKSIANDQVLEALKSNDDDEDQLEETDEDVDFDPGTSILPKKRIQYVTDEICESLIKSNMSSMEAFKKFKQDILASGGNVDDYILSPQTISKRLREYQAKLSSGQQPQQQPDPIQQQQPQQSNSIQPQQPDPIQQQQPQQSNLIQPQQPNPIQQKQPNPIQQTNNKVENCEIVSIVDVYTHKIFKAFQ